MKRILYLQASPRAGRSVSIAIADAFAQTLTTKQPDLEIVTLNLFNASLPPFDAEAAAGKYALMRGDDASSASKGKWRATEEVIEEFKSFDAYLLAVPMWNFGIPYPLKHFLDVIVQPGYTFTVGDNGYEGLMLNRKAAFAFASGGAYDDMPEIDHQKTYIRQIFGFMGITDQTEMAAQGMMSPDAEDNKSAAIAAARTAAEAWLS